jgi:hypothetical protein
VAQLIGPELGWDRARTESEAEAYAEERRAELTRAGLDPDRHPGGPGGLGGLDRQAGVARTGSGPTGGASG